MIVWGVAELLEQLHVESKSECNRPLYHSDLQACGQATLTHAM